MSLKEDPFALPRLLSDEDLTEFFPPTAANTAPPSVTVDSVSVQVPCEHWRQVLRQAHDRLGLKNIRHFSTIFSPVDFESVRECEHSLDMVLSTALKDLELWPQAGLEVTCALIKSLAIVLAKMLDRGHPLWTKVLDWVVKCIDNPMQEGAWMVGMEFLAQLHAEVNWDLRGAFPELIAKLGDLDDRKRFPTGFRYCLDVGSRVPQLCPTIKTSKSCESQPLYLEEGMLQFLILEEVLQYLDYESIANLRATCQLVRGAVDDVTGANSRLRRNIGNNRKAYLWLRAKPNISELTVKNKPNVRRPFQIDLDLVDNRVYATLEHDKGLEMADISSPRPAPVFSTSVHKTGTTMRLWTSFDQMAHEVISLKEWEQCGSVVFRSFEKRIKAKDCVVRARYVERTNATPGKFEVLIENVVVQSYATGHNDQLWMKASFSKETVFMLYRGRFTGSGSLYLLETLDVRSRRITASVHFDITDSTFVYSGYGNKTGPLQCASDDFIITQKKGFFKAFARVDNEWVNVGEKLVDFELQTLLIRDGLAVWKETQGEITITETVVNILDVRPATLERICRNGENVFDLPKQIHVPGYYVIKPFERGFFGFDHSHPRKVVKIKIFDMEVTSDSK